MSIAKKRERPTDHTTQILALIALGKRFLLYSSSDNIMHRKTGLRSLRSIRE